MTLPTGLGSGSHAAGVLVALALAVVVASGTHVARAEDATQDYEADVFHSPDGKTLPFRLLKPKDYDPKQKYPLVIFFHGAGERGDDNAAQLRHGAPLFDKPEVREKFPCFVVAPQCPARQQWVNVPWGDPKEVQPEEPSESMRLALELVDKLRKDYSIDPGRLYVTGLSMGGYATWDVITRHPKMFAAAVPICGGGDEAKAKLITRVPVWAFHSDDDPVVKVQRTRNLVKAVEDAGGKPKYTEYHGLGHFSWGKAYGEAELLPWLFAQKLGEPDTRP